MAKMIMVDDTPIKYAIWDTAGQEKYHSLAPMYYRGAAAAIVVYDITRKATFQTLKNWVKELRQLGPENIVIAIAGNKCDLEDQRVHPTARPRPAILLTTCLILPLILTMLLPRIMLSTCCVSQDLPTAAGREYAEEIGALFVETSAKEDTNVHDLFVEISESTICVRVAARRCASLRVAALAHTLTALLAFFALVR